MGVNRHEMLYGTAVSFFRGTQLGDPTRAARWRAALWVATGTDRAGHAALEALQCEPDRCVPGPLYSALDPRDRLLLDAAASLLRDDVLISLSALARDLDDVRLTLVLDGIGLLHGSALSAHVESMAMTAIGRRG